MIGIAHFGCYSREPIPACLLTLEAERSGDAGGLPGLSIFSRQSATTTSLGWIPHDSRQVINRAAANRKTRKSWSSTRGRRSWAPKERSLIGAPQSNNSSLPSTTLPSSPVPSSSDQWCASTSNARLVLAVVLGSGQLCRRSGTSILNASHFTHLTSPVSANAPSQTFHTIPHRRSLMLTSSRFNSGVVARARKTAQRRFIARMRTAL